MNLRFPVFALLLIAAMTCIGAPALAGALDPASAPTPTLLTPALSADESAEPGVDPFYGLGDLRSKAVPVAFCICEIGVNCCGDPQTLGKRCSLDNSCRCNHNDDCIH